MRHSIDKFRHWMLMYLFRRLVIQYYSSSLDVTDIDKERRAITIDLTPSEWQIIETLAAYAEKPLSEMLTNWILNRALGRNGIGN